MNKALAIGDIVLVPEPEKKLHDIHETPFTGRIMAFKHVPSFGSCVTVQRSDGELFDIEIDRVEKAE